MGEDAASCLPAAPEGRYWKISLDGDDRLTVRLMGYRDGYHNVVLAEESRRLVNSGRDYRFTTGPGTAVQLAETILRRIEAAEYISGLIGEQVHLV